MPGGTAGQVMNFSVLHIASWTHAHMPMILEAYDVEVTPYWAKQEVYGRMDPIFTYQNTTRTFTAILRTAGVGEIFDDTQFHAMTDGDSILNQAHFEIVSAQDDDEADEMGISRNKYKFKALGTKEYLKQIAQLFKIHYPLYSTYDNRGTGFLLASPLLRIGLQGLTYNEGAHQYYGRDDLGNYYHKSAMLYVPETFKVSSISKAAGTAISVTSVEQLRFGAPAEGWTVTLGGTVMHENARVGWVYDADTSSVRFDQGTDFPFAIQAQGDPGNIPTDEASQREAAPGTAPRAQQQRYVDTVLNRYCDNDAVTPSIRESKGCHDSDGDGDPDSAPGYYRDDEGLWQTDD